MHEPLQHAPFQKNILALAAFAQQWRTDIRALLAIGEQPICVVDLLAILTDFVDFLVHFRVFLAFEQRFVEYVVSLADSRFSQAFARESGSSRSEKLTP